MNRFVIVDGLPYLYANEKTYRVRWNEKGFSVGDEVNLDLKEKPVTHSELSIKAKCTELDSIKVKKKAKETVESK